MARKVWRDPRRCESCSSSRGVITVTLGPAPADLVGATASAPVTTKWTCHNEDCDDFKVDRPLDFDLFTLVLIEECDEYFKPRRFDIGGTMWAAHGPGAPTITGSPLSYDSSAVADHPCPSCGIRPEWFLQHKQGATTYGPDDSGASSLIGAVRYFICGCGAVSYWGAVRAPSLADMADILTSKEWFT